MGTLNGYWSIGNSEKILNYWLRITCITWNGTNVHDVRTLFQTSNPKRYPFCVSFMKSDLLSVSFSRLEIIKEYWTLGNSERVRILRKSEKVWTIGNYERVMD